jgi:hypothetical protein
LVNTVFAIIQLNKLQYKMTTLKVKSKNHWLENTLHLVHLALKHSMFS